MSCYWGGAVVSDGGTVVSKAFSKGPFSLTYVVKGTFKAVNNVYDIRGTAIGLK